MKNITVIQADSVEDMPSEGAIVCVTGRMNTPYVTHVGIRKFWEKPHGYNENDREWTARCMYTYYTEHEYYSGVKRSNWTQMYDAEYKVSMARIGNIPLDPSLLGTKITATETVVDSMIKVEYVEDRYKYYKVIIRALPQCDITCIAKFEKGKLCALNDRIPFFYHLEKDYPCEKLPEQLINEAYNSYKSFLHFSIGVWLCFVFLLFILYFPSESKISYASSSRHNAEIDYDNYITEKGYLYLIKLLVPGCIIGLMLCCMHLLNKNAENMVDISVPDIVGILYFFIFLPLILVHVLLYFAQRYLLTPFYQNHIIEKMVREDQESFYSGDYDIISHTDFNNMGIIERLEDDEGHVFGSSKEHITHSDFVYYIDASNITFEFFNFRISRKESGNKSVSYIPVFNSFCMRVPLEDEERAHRCIDVNRQMIENAFREMLGKCKLHFVVQEGSLIVIAPIDVDGGTPFRISIEVTDFNKCINRDAMTIAVMRHITNKIIL